MTYYKSACRFIAKLVSGKWKKGRYNKCRTTSSDIATKRGPATVLYMAWLNTGSPRTLYLLEVYLLSSNLLRALIRGSKHKSSVSICRFKHLNFLELQIGTSARGIKELDEKPNVDIKRYEMSTEGIADFHIAALLWKIY